MDVMRHSINKYNSSQITISFPRQNSHFIKSFITINNIKKFTNRKEIIFGKLFFSY